MPDLFVGVVSHRGSRFAVSQGPDGAAEELAGELRRLGRDVVVRVNIEDAYEPAMLAIDPSLVRRSFLAQLRTEWRWRTYLRGGISSTSGRAGRWARDVTEMVAAAALRTRILRPGSGGPGTAGERMLRRLLNIELSHAVLLREGVALGSEWVLILEDDAFLSDVADAAVGLASLMGDSAGHRPQYVNVSESHTADELGIESLLQELPEQAWAGTVRRSILAASRPVTNTVCAILYRRDCAAHVLRSLQESSLDPVIAIDWKLNLVLMDRYRVGALGAGDCWFVEPGPFQQRSMRDTP